MSNLKFSENLNEKNYYNNNNYNNINNKEFKNEEIEIKKLIEDINKIEENINNLNNFLSNKEPKLKKLSELEKIKNTLQNNISQNNNNISIEIKKNDISSEHKKILINELDQKINENKIKLNSINTLNFKSLILIKYIFSNKSKNGFLSKEQIENILNNRNSNVSDEEELKKIMKEKEINKASENVIENNLLNYKLKKEQIEENFNMLEEEKNSTNDELIDIISCKESADSIINIIIENLLKNKNNFNKNKNMSINNNIDNEKKEEVEINKPIDILIDELLCLDSAKTAAKICDELYNIYELDKKNNNQNYSYKSNIHDNKTKNKNKNRSGSYESDIIHNKNIIDNIENDNKNNFKTHKRSGSNNITNNIVVDLKDNNINKEKQSININIIQVKKSENNLDKKILSKLIQNEFETFLSTQNIQYNSNNIEDNLLNDFLYNLSMIIINKIKNIIEKENNKIFISSNDLMIYLSYLLKSFYYETLIEKYYKFIIKDYKLLKKDIKKIISEITNESIKLGDKLDEIKIKEKININMIEIIKKKLNNTDNQTQNKNLTKDELSYIDICKLLNNLISEREKIKNEIDKNNNDLKMKKEENEIKNNKFNNQIFNINNEIKEINDDIEKTTIKNNEDIINYRKIIADKFEQIKKILELYKNQKIDNMSEYNQFVEKINNSIKQNLNKSSVFKFENIFKGNNDNNTFLNGNNEIINNDEKNNFEKKLLKKNKKTTMGIEINGLNLNMKNDSKIISKKLNRSMTGINIRNNNINNIYNIFNNIDNSISFNNKSNIINNKDKDIMNKTSNNIFSVHKQNLSILNNSKNLENHQINFNIPFNKKKHYIYNISSIPNANNEDTTNNTNNTNNLNIITKSLNSNKNKSSINIRAKIKEIKKINNKLSNLKNNNIPNTNININKIIFQSKKSPFHIGNKNNSSRVFIDEQLKLNKLIKQKKATSHEKVNAPSLPLDSHNLYIKKLNPLTKNTFCYYREMLIDNQNIIKYNPLKNISLDSLCESPYNFKKSSINLNNNYDLINIMIYNNKNNNDNIFIKIKIKEIENTVVSSSLKKIIEIYRNYNKYKDNNNFSFEEFINTESKLFPDMNREDIEKSAFNQNYNFSLIINKGKRLEFIICSYEEFKMWINGLAFIIKNKKEFIKKDKDY